MYDVKGLPRRWYLASLLMPALVIAASSTNYSVHQHIVDAGGGTASSFDYTLRAYSFHGHALGSSSSSLYTTYGGFVSMTDADGDRIPDSVDPDDDNDGLSDNQEATLGTNPYIGDTDGDGLSDFDEVNADGNPSNYSPGIDTDPDNPDTDGDGIPDGSDPVINLYDGDLAPRAAPNGFKNIADFLVAQRIVLGLETVTTTDLEHGDVYPPGAPDGVINQSDAMLILQKILVP